MCTITHRTATSSNDFASADLSRSTAFAYAATPKAPVLHRYIVLTGHAGDGLEEVACFTVYGRPGGARLTSRLRINARFNDGVAIKAQATTSGSGFHRASGCLSDVLDAAGIRLTWTNKDAMLHGGGDGVLKDALGAVVAALGLKAWSIIEIHA